MQNLWKVQLRNFSNTSAYNRCDCGISDPFGMEADDDEVPSTSKKDKKSDDPDAELFKRFQQMVITECTGCEFCGG